MRLLALRVLLLIPASALPALGWLPYGIMTEQSSAAEPPAGNAPGLDPPLPRKSSPVLEPSLMGPSGPTGFAQFPGYGCSGPCEVGQLSSVSCASATSCTAVGGAKIALDGGLEGEPLAEGWDGTSWTIVPMPSPSEAEHSTLDGVSCPAARMCIAVGNYYDTATSTYEPLAELWNGSSWTVRGPPSPSGATSTSLDYVQCASASACMTVGSYYNPTSEQSLPLAEFWNGSGWTIEAVPLPTGGADGWLLGVSCPSAATCTAVGEYATSLAGERLTLAEHWNGTSWSVQPTPNPAGTTGTTLHAAWCESASSCIAVGSYGNGGGDGLALAESWNGTSWTVLPTPNPSGSTYSSLANVSCAPTGTPCEAIGSSEGGTLAESWNGTSWTAQSAASTPEGSTAASFSDVSCTSATACTVVGKYLDPETGSWLTLAERWGGTNWTAEPTPDAAAIATGAATEMTTSSAALHGMVDPDGATVTNCRFDYGTTTAYGSSVPCAQLPGGGTAPVEVSADLSGLSPGVTYYFQLVVTNAGGTTSGGFLDSSSSFTTGGSGGATASTGVATDVTSTSATLNGTAGASSGTVTSCRFEYGETSGAYSSKAPCAQTVGIGTSPVAVSASVTGLLPGTTYHFRLVLESSNGTGFGTDETFMTAGSSPPTVATRYPLTGWPEIALLGGEINAHGNDVLYGFEYGRSYVEEHFTGWLGHVASTSPTSVEYTQHGLQPDVRYYVRLVVFYQGITYVRGNTLSFEIKPPEPEATEEPYLEANGGDAEKGFVLRCNPGTWRNTAGFKYEWYGGSHLSDTQEYSVTKADIGHRVQCRVTPYQLNGQADEVAALMTEPPYLPEGANDIIIPEWAKVGFAAGDGAYEGGEAATDIACVVLTDGACAAIVAMDLAKVVVTELLASSVDPPDGDYKDIAIPASRSFSTVRRSSCARDLSHKSCATLARLARRYGSAAARATSVIEAFAISRNRTLIARKKKDSLALLVQAAARKVYVGLLAAAYVELNSAGLVYAEALRHARLDVRIGAAAIRRSENRPYTEVIGRSLLQRMLRFATRADIKKAVEVAGRHAAAFDLAKTLRMALPTALLERYYATLDLNDVTSLVDGLEGQRALSTTSGRGLLVDVAHARAACTQSRRNVAIAAFLRDAKSAIAASYYRLLVAAAQPLVNGSSTVDPYPRCHS